MSRPCGRRGCEAPAYGRTYYCSWQHRNEEWDLRERDRAERRKAERQRAQGGLPPPTCRHEGCTLEWAEGRQLCARHALARDRAGRGQVPPHRVYFQGVDLVVSCATCGAREALGKAGSLAAARATRPAARAWACEHDCEKGATNHAS